LDGAAGRAEMIGNGQHGMTFWHRLALGLVIALMAARGVWSAGAALDWADNTESDFDHYNVYRSAVPGGPYARINAAPIRVSEYDDVGLDPGDLCCYVVTAVDKSGNESGVSNEVVIRLNRPPVADAGPDQIVSMRRPAILDGSASYDADGDVVATLWLQSAGPEVELDSSISSVTTFIAPMVDQPTTLAFELIVWDDQMTTASDTVEIGIDTALPIANAGPDQQARGGQQVVLDGSGSMDPNGEISAWLWLQIAGPEEVNLSVSSINPVTSFTVPSTSGFAVYTFELHVWDNDNLEGVDTVNVAINNDPPQARVAPGGEIDEGRTGTLDGSGSSDPDGTLAGYLWMQTSGPDVVIDNAVEPVTTFVAPHMDTPEPLSFLLVVWDDGLSTGTAEVSFTVNQKPRAQILVSDARPNETKMVSLDGSRSSDPEGRPLTYLWEQTAGPAVALSATSSASATFVAPRVPRVTTLEFRLTVSDGRLSHSATVNVTVFPGRPNE